MWVRDYLRDRRVHFQTLLHNPASSATRLAHCLHVSGRNVAKGVLLRTEGGYVLAVLPATHRIDLKILADLLRFSTLELAAEEEIESVFHDCQPGALPPFGHLYGVRTIVDPALARSHRIVMEGNTRHEGIRMRYRDYEAIEAPAFASFAVPISSAKLRAERKTN
ncbi:MAG: aminoacyl-tRNA deacylase [Isosphaeraceae bacterium]